MSIPISALNLEKAVYYHSEQFPPYNLDYKKLIAPLGRATNSLARFDQMLKTMPADQEILLAPLRNQEAVISSRMEGTISTMDEILKFEADHDEDDDDADDVRGDVIETILYQRALKAGQNALLDGRDISEHLIKSLHQRLLSFGRGAEKSPGDYKNEQNYLVDRSRRNVLFVPINPQQLQSGMEKLVHYIHHGDEEILLKTAISHVEFEALHPFKDGNGRIGRMIITLMLWHFGRISAPHFYISGYLEEQKDTYIDTMRAVSQHNDWTGWCLFFLEALEQQAIRNLKTAEQIKTLYEDMKVVFNDVLASRWSVNALDYVFKNPIFRNNKFASASGVPAYTAMKFTKLLLEKELIVTREEASGRRPALYSFEPLMELVRV